MSIAIRGFVPVVAATAFWGDAAVGEDERFHAGVRGVLTVADGEPANDIPGFGVSGLMRLSERWAVGVAVEATEYDFEEPAGAIGIAQDPMLEPIDVVAEGVTLGIWLERTYGRGSLDWFVGAGLAVASIDVPDATGPRADGGSFDIRTEVDPEMIVAVMAGLRRRLGERWFVEFGLRAEQHFADWQMTDRVTGTQGTIGDYFAYGGHLGVGVRF